MNYLTAQNLVRCYRPGKSTDARTDKAVRFAENDPELCKELSEQIAFDDHIVDVIHCITPPDDLRQKLNELGHRPEEKKSFRSQIINPAVLTAVLGGLVIVGVLVFLLIDRMEKFPGREAVEAMLGEASKMSGAELERISMPVDQLGDWLFVRGYDGYENPADVASRQVIGARVYRIDGRPVAQLALGSGESLECLLFEFHASEFGVQLSNDGEWKIIPADQWVGAVRQRGDHCVLIAFRGARAEMQNFLKSLPQK